MRQNAVKPWQSCRQREVDFHPADPDRVTMYVCGPTVYGPAGNARPAVVFDVLARLLRYLYPRLIYARNITDVDDKINAKAVDAGVDISVISDLFSEIPRRYVAFGGCRP